MLKIRSANNNKGIHEIIQQDNNIGLTIGSKSFLLSFSTGIFFTDLASSGIILHFSVAGGKSGRDFRGNIGQTEEI